MVVVASWGWIHGDGGWAGRERSRGRSPPRDGLRSRCYSLGPNVAAMFSGSDPPCRQSRRFPPSDVVPSASGRSGGEFERADVHGSAPSRSPTPAPAPASPHLAETHRETAPPAHRSAPGAPASSRSDARRVDASSTHSMTPRPSLRHQNHPPPSLQRQPLAEPRLQPRDYEAGPTPSHLHSSALASPNYQLFSRETLPDGCRFRRNSYIWTPQHEPLQHNCVVRR